ncbi:ankyrin repeat-containing domain protein [Dactylonectria macrodidyma]|uniref:Ankyrin repeat-containing domain protein n=1 Tax=Dactylonectria macrodidyma TaxID=307937 RepID=A0A9P9JF85_9HYPO|nr:ankyrin repeat-containing domain protein [Dactylonectria macrodidyma]
MSRAPRIPATEWNAHKEHIRFLYIDKDKTLGELVNCMEEEHGFHATKAQYVRKLDSWNMRKYHTMEEWKHASALFRKRKGRDTELVMGGQVIRGKKLKKEMGRYAYLQTSFHAPSVEPRTSLDGIIARTPPFPQCPLILCNNLPWFQFQDHLIELACSKPPILNLNWMPPSGAITLSHTAHVLELAKRFLGYSLPETPADTNDLHDLSKSLEDMVPKREHSNSDLHIQKLSPSQSLVQVIQWAVYQSSNGLLPTEKTDDLLRWVVETGNKSAIDQLLGAKGPTARIFASNIFLSAIRIGNADYVRRLLDRGVSPDSADPIFSGKTALQFAVGTANLEITELLLNRGADVDLTISGPFRGLRPLLLAIDNGRGSLQLVDMLIIAGADMDASTVSGGFPLLMATEERNIEVAKLLIASGADVDNTGERFGSALQGAVKLNDIDMAKILLDAGADVNIPLGDEYTIVWQELLEVDLDKLDLDPLSVCTPIQIATFNGNKQMVRLLLGAGAFINELWFQIPIPSKRLVAMHNDEEEDWIGLRDPLQLSVLKGDLGIAELLLNAGANPNAVDAVGTTALQLLCSKSHQSSVQSLEMATLLLRRDADVNAPAGRNRYGSTALQAAANYGDAALVSLLLEHGADPNAPLCDKGGRTALQAAAESGNLDLVLLFIAMGQSINADAAGEEGLTCLQAAALSGNLELVSMLLQLGAEVNAKASPNRGRTTLQAAVESGNLEVVQRLLSAGAHVNRIEDGRTALCTAVKKQDYKFVDFLMANGANPDPPMARETPLVVAITLNKHDVVQRLLRAGVNVNGPSFDCHSAILLRHGKFSTPHTPLLAAVHRGNLEEVKMLLDAGANPNLTNPEDGASPLHYSLDNIDSNERITELLIRYGADVNMPSCDTIYPVQVAARKPEAAMQMLIDSGANVNTPTSAISNMTALQRAVSGRDRGLVNILFDAKADINAPADSFGGRTALQAAAESGDLPLVRELISRGANVNAPAASNSGATALQFAAMTGDINMAILLLENGADVNAEPAAHEGRTALQGAAEHGRLDMVHLLLENDGDMDSLEARCEEAAAFAEDNHHAIIADVLLKWRRL